jgi:Spy/CpxP family protein refolding chaperone
MKKRIVLFTAALTLMVLIAVPFAFAQRGHRGMAAGNDMSIMMLGHLQHAKQVLGLSDQQVTDIETILSDLRAQNKQYRESIHGGMAGILQTLIANPNDLASAQAQLDKQTAAENAMKLNALTAVSKALNVLTPDQRTKLQGIVQDRMSRHFEK